MYLKAIEIAGFKSFAQKINFQFEKGITGIVGPNGSGKSNVADAVRWVLGEQSAKQLRSQNMQDVIFAGTQNRKPLGYAYVFITFGNEDHALAIDYDEVTIGRRVYKSGESEYLLNGASCRLKDVQELFFDTGIGKEGYSIIGQGQIDKILSSKPEDRRELFDEAAGIVKFKKRKAVAIRKLEKEEQNFNRVHDILNELERQSVPLLKQSQTAKKYLDYYEQLKKCEINQFLVDSAEVSKSVLKLSEAKKLLEDQLLDLQEKSESQKEIQEQLRQKQKQVQERLQNLQQLLLETNTSLQRTNSNIAVSKEQIRSQRNSEELTKNRVSQLLEACSELENELVDLDTQKEGLSDKEKGYQLEVDKWQSKNTVSLEALEQLRQEGSRLKENQLQYLEQKSNLLVNRQKADTLLEQNRLRFTKVQSDFLKVISNRQDLEKKEQALGIEYTSLQEDCKQNEQKLKEYRITFDKQKETQAQYEKNRSHLQKEYQELSVRLDTLESMAERYEGYGNSVRVLMNEKHRFPGMEGVVADLIQVEKHYETAIETALGGAIQNIVTDTEYTAKDCIEFLKQKRAGRATFLPISTIHPMNGFDKKEALGEEGVIAVASELVHTASKYQDIIYFLLNKIVVVDTIDHALKLAKKYHYRFRIVTLEGEQINVGGSLSGGVYKRNANLLGRNRKLEDLNEKKKECKENIKSLEVDLQELAKKKEKMTMLYNEAKQTRGTLKETVSTLYLKKKENQLALSTIKEQERDFRLEMEELEEDKLRYESNGKEANEELVKIEKQLVKIQTDLEEYEEKSQVLLKDNEEVLEQIRLLQTEQAKISQKYEFLETEKLRIKNEISGNYEEICHLEKGLNDAFEMIEQKKKEISANEQELISLEEKIQKFNNQIQAVSKERDDIDSKLNKEILDREKISGDLSAADKEVYRISQQIENLEDKKEKQIEYLWSTYEITPSETKNYQDESLLKNTSEIKKKVYNLKEEIKNLGNVNVNAIEEYKELSTRLDFMRGQYDDLSKAKEQLQELIQDLDLGMRKQFSEKFKEIRKEFDIVFKQLFGGGQASLDLVNSSDNTILDAGIQIIAQPPGKKLQNMMQLSGGEKALTAISLLFAIQKLKPSPFCLLDEIEAALDDANIDRFADYLNQLKEDVQFIVITHRKGTMMIADRLYGITMQEKGISSLVSVDLINAS